MKSVWKKVALSTAMFTMSFGSLASGLESQVQRKIENIQKILSGLEREVYYMNQSDLIETDTKLKQAMVALRFNRRHPHPGPGPGPRPFPPRQRVFTVTGTLERSNFNFEVTDTKDLAFQCTNFFKSMRGATDEATIAVNFSAPRSIKTSGFWHGSAEPCVEIAAAAYEMGVNDSTSSLYTAVGSIENKAFTFQGRTLTDIMNQCVDFYTTQVRGASDELTIFNGQRVIKEKTSGFWHTANEVCNVMMQHVR